MGSTWILRARLRSRAGWRLSRSWRARTAPYPGELIARSAELNAELASIERADTDLAALRKDLASALEEFRTLAGQLSAKRTTAGRALSKDITTRMQSLGMAGGRFQVEVTQDGTQEPTQHGVDQIEFRVTANPGQPLRAAVESGLGR